MAETGKPLDGLSGGRENKNRLHHDLIRHLWEELYEMNNALHQRFYQETLPRSWAQIDQELKERLGKCKVKLDLIKESNALIRYCLSTLNESLQGKLKSIFIRPEHRSKGIGTLSMELHPAWLKYNEASEVFCLSTPLIRERFFFTDVSVSFPIAR